MMLWFRRVSETPRFWLVEDLRLVGRRACPLGGSRGGHAFYLEFPLCLQRTDVLSLPALWPLGHIELNTLAFLQAAEAACLNRREVHKYIFATLTADKAVAFGVVKPLYCSLFCHFVTVSFSIDLRCEIGGTKGRFKLVCKKLLNNRF
jgi:hypothetical protein